MHLNQEVISYVGLELARTSYRIFPCSLSFISDHAAELGNAVPTKPLIFMKPPSSFIQAGQNIEVELFELALMTMIIM